MSYQAVHETLQKAHVQAAIMGANEDAVQAILAMRGRAAQVAFKTLIRLAEGEPDEDGEYTVPHAVQKQAASDLLDRLGIVREVAVKPADGTPAGLLPANLSPAQLKAIAWGEEEAEEQQQGIEAENALVLDLVPDEPDDEPDELPGP